jgi:hypothetical protein
MPFLQAKQVPAKEKHSQMGPAALGMFDRHTVMSAVPSRPHAVTLFPRLDSVTDGGYMADDLVAGYNRTRLKVANNQYAGPLQN